MGRIYRYILASDTGMAPCPFDDVITLATCKPKIRSSAGIGDWVSGFMPGTTQRGQLVWAGRVEQILPVGEYERRYRGRPDAVYREENGSFLPLLPGYHDHLGQRRKDLSAPVLIFERGASWYFGAEPRGLPAELVHLAPSGQGHRVNGANEGDERKLEAWLQGVAKPGSRGRRRDAGPASSSSDCGRPSGPAKPQRPRGKAKACR